MKHGATRTLYQYWDGIRDNRPAPERGDIHPAAIKSVLGDTFILEVKSPLSYKFRLAGTRLCSAFCKELKGRDFLNGWSNKDREAIAAVLSTIIKDRAAAVIGIQCEAAKGYKLDMEMLLLPVHVRGEGCTRVLGCAVPMQRPIWLGSTPITNQSVTSLRLIWPDDDLDLRDVPVEVHHFKSFSRNRSRPGVTMDTTPQVERPAADAAYAGTFGHARRVKHLRVIDGGKHAL
ncbi:MULTISPECIES: PAS domain-containing protein [Pseudovibrio]|uniref:PAS domain-containing protein n=1 Tax=Stappiaceae TaxID=2821832 RepID=UPI0023658485|nr:MULTISPECIES: PAS domain-containing protein [Pseudovibrio]MDD7910535.1 PAS domain-containing protein [Pseudovibrio exalbescens]MDX5594616.1 PAS domain-containing protein [Pseudovibrio sp. SPO723]